MYLLEQNVKFAAKRVIGRAKKFFTEENGEVNIVATVVLIGIAVLLAVIFKNNIISLLNNLFGTINTTATEAVTSGN